MVSSGYYFMRFLLPRAFGILVTFCWRFDSGSLSRLDNCDSSFSIPFRRFSHSFLKWPKSSTIRAVFASSAHENRNPVPVIPTPIVAKVRACGLSWGCMDTDVRSTPASPTIDGQFAAGGYPPFFRTSVFAIKAGVKARRRRVMLQRAFTGENSIFFTSPSRTLSCPMGSIPTPRPTPAHSRTIEIIRQMFM